MTSNLVLCRGYLYTQFPMDKILDLKNRPEPKEPERYESPIKKVEEKITNPSSVRGPIPIMLTWSGPLYHYFPNTKLLLGAITVLGLTGMFFVFIQRNIFAAGFFFLSMIMLFVISRQTPPIVEFTIGPLSVKAGLREYKFSEIKSFWIEYNSGGLKELSFQVKKWYIPYIKIPLMDEDPVQVSAILLKFIPEVEHEDSMLDSFSRLLGV